MKGSIKPDRRSEKRYPQDHEVLVKELPGCDEGEPEAAPTIRGRIQNISSKGLCLVTVQPIHTLAIVRCELPVCDSGVRVPTLMQVRWTRIQGGAGEEYIAGLQALL